MTTCFGTEFTSQYNDCIGKNGNITDLLANWQAIDCPNIFSIFINTNPDNKCLIEYSSTSQQVLTKDINTYLFPTYLSKYTITDNVFSPTYNGFQNTLLDMCTNSALPGVCANFLTDYCANSGFEPRQAALDSPIRGKFCGCYVPPNEELVAHTHGTCGCVNGNVPCSSCVPEPDSDDKCPVLGPGTGLCPRVPACDSLCARANTSRRANVMNGRIINCPQAVCIIDDITINATSSSVPGGINFNTVCAGCNQGAGCRCVISGVSITKTLADIGLGANFGLFCGKESTCFVNDEQVECASRLEEIVPTYSTMPNYGMILLVLLVVIIFLILGFLSYYYY
jgi:hypothetical protein